MIRLDNVRLHKGLLMQFELCVAAGQKVALIGSSGAGKTTLLNLIAGFEQPEQGEIWLAGEKLSKKAPHLRPVSMLFQENNLFNHLTVAQNLALGLNPNLKLNASQQKQLKEVASAVGLQDFLTRLPSQLSGGQKQRAALARCLLRDKPILLLDEPFSALDPELREEMWQLIEQLCTEKNLTLLLVTHQVAELQDKVDRIVKVENGQIVEN